MKLRGKGILVHLFRKVGIERIGLAAFVLSLRILQPFRKRNRKFRGLENYGRRSPIPTKKTPASVSFPSKYFKMQGWRNIRILFKLAITELLDIIRICWSRTLHGCAENRCQTSVCLAFGMMELPLEWGVEGVVLMENIIVWILSTLSSSHCKYKWEKVWGTFPKRLCNENNGIEPIRIVYAITFRNSQYHPKPIS